MGLDITIKYSTCINDSNFKFTYGKISITVNLLYRDECWQFNSLMTLVSESSYRALAIWKKFFFYAVIPRQFDIHGSESHCGVMKMGVYPQSSSLLWVDLC